MDFNTDIKYVKGVGETVSALFRRLGVNTVGELITFYPRDYEDWSEPVDVLDAPLGENVCIRAVPTAPVTASRTKNGGVISKTVAQSGGGYLALTFFNNKYVSSSLREGEEYLFYGKIDSILLGGAQMLSPKFAKADKAGYLHPVYRLTHGLSSKKIEQTVRNALSALSGAIRETLPKETAEKYRLMPLEQALRTVHFPESASALRLARRRLIFEELLLMQLGLMLLGSRARRSGSTPFTLDDSDTFLSLLPFKPTNAQLRCIRECVADMRSERPMNRLLQGDVGSGKTCVAAALIWNAAKNGYQSAMMAPTEILAEQHADTLSSFFAGRLNIALLTGSVKESQKKNIRRLLKSGEIDLVVGTHALLSDNVEFNSLGFVITDEQHRFGVKQRAALTKKGSSPHTLVMSATPIPRTLAMLVYGDLDISVLDELPVGRQPVATYCVTGDYRPRLYKFIKNALDGGRQAYIICPLVEENDSPLKAAEEYFEKLKNGEFAGYSLGLLHGRLKSGEKEKIMRSFASGEIGLLVATVVVEVGVDVPNATVMMIENAERFGLSQLHQLRGRVGRGSEKSYCVLVSDAQSEQSQKRLSVMCETNDGFVIAEEDLKQRGPGDLLGSRQHGLPEFKLANILTDAKILYAAQEEARLILGEDRDLARPKNRGLLNELTKKFADI